MHVKTLIDYVLLASLEPQIDQGLLDQGLLGRGLRVMTCYFINYFHVAALEWGEGGGGSPSDEDPDGGQIHCYKYFPRLNAKADSVALYSRLAMDRHLLGTHSLNDRLDCTTLHL